MTCSHRAMLCGVMATSGRFIAVSRLGQRAPVGQGHPPRASVNNRAIPELNNPEAVMLNSIASLWKTTPCSGPFWPTCSKSRVSKVVECASAEAAEFVLVSTGTELRALVTDVNLAGD